MANIHPKHGFVEENPYLVYNNENDTTLSDVTFSLLPASADTLGGIKVGSNLSITDDGVLSASGGGGGGGVFIVNESADDTLDKTWQEISDAGFSVLLRSETGERLLQMSCIEDEGDYIVTYWTYGMHDPRLYIASSTSGYPVLDA